MSPLAWYLLFGLVAGLLTTLSGQGGGLFLLLVLSWRVGPHAALAMTTPALLLGNLHRSVLGRHHIVWPIGRGFLWGAVPASVVGGLFAGAAPDGFLRVVLIVLTAASIAKALGWLRFSLPVKAFPVAGAGVGLLTGTSGGAGMILAPILLASGLTGAPYIATQSMIAVAMHGGRLAAYGGAGLLSGLDLHGTAAITVAIFAGNWLADRAKQRITPATVTRIEYGTLVVCTSLAVLGVAH